MEIQVKDRKDRQLVKLSLSQDATLLELKKAFQKNYKSSLYPSRQWFNIGDAKGEALKDDDKKLKDQGVKSGVTLVFKDLGPQVSWRLVFLVEYVGPIIILCLFRFLQNIKLKTTQEVAFWMVMGHYGKREFETLFVHRFSNQTMPFKRIFINSFHYWVIFGVCVGYFTMHKDFTEFGWDQTAQYILIGVFVFAELMNGACHMVLRNLRPAGSKARGIPHGFGFDLVSCANYFWETIVWLSFSLYVMSVPAYIFLAFSFYQMTDWALKKHARYIKEFPDYPKNRKAIVPFVI